MNSINWFEQSEKFNIRVEILKSLGFKIVSNRMEKYDFNISSDDINNLSDEEFNVRINNFKTNS